MNWDLTLCLAASMPDMGEIWTTPKDGCYYPHVAGKATECQRSQTTYASHRIGRCLFKVIVSSTLCTGVCRAPKQWFSIGGNRVSSPPLETFANVWQHFWLSWFGIEDATKILWTKARDAAKHLTVYRKLTTTKNSFVQNVSGAEVGKPPSTVRKRQTHMRESMASLEQRGWNWKEDPAKEPWTNKYFQRRSTSHGAVL